MGPRRTCNLKKATWVILKPSWEKPKAFLWSKADLGLLSHHTWSILGEPLTDGGAAPDEGLAFTSHLVLLPKFPCEVQPTFLVVVFSSSIV